MSYRGFFAGLVCVCLSLPLSAQISRDAKYDILRSVIAEQAAARVALPFGADGVELSDSGDVNKERLERDLRKNGQSIEPGKVVTVTNITFDDDKIDVELDGGGKNKKSVLDRIQVGVGSGNTTTPLPGMTRQRRPKDRRLYCGSQKKFRAL